MTDPLDRRRWRQLLKEQGVQEPNDEFEDCETLEYLARKKHVTVDGLLREILKDTPRQESKEKLSASRR